MGGGTIEQKIMGCATDDQKSTRLLIKKQNKFLNHALENSLNKHRKLLARKLVTFTQCCKATFSILNI